MSGPWWTRERSPAAAAALADSSTGVVPVVMPEDVRSLIDRLRARIPGFTPDWAGWEVDGDPGRVLAQLFAEQFEEVRSRANRLPEKAFVELLRIAGVEQAPATPAEALLEFALSPAAKSSVLVPQGFQVSAASADGSPERVVFETERGLNVFPGRVAEIFIQDGGALQSVTPENDDPDGDFLAFGEAPRAGAALWIGLSGDTPPSASLSVLVALAPRAGAPPPVSAGGGSPALPPTLYLQWEVLDSGAWSPVAVASDDTDALRRSGIVEVRVPERWLPARPSALGAGAPRRWLRIRVRHGTLDEPLALRFIRVNAVRAVAARSVRNEVPEIVPGSGGSRRRLRSAPVVPGSLVLQIDEGRELRRWREVHDLGEEAADAEVFTLDEVQGEIAFGDGVRGARVPEGFRNVVALRYQVGGGTAGAVDVDAITSLVSSAPFVTKVSNPLPASGGMDAEPREATLRRGPALLRAGGRAVTLADYELMARFAPGAQVARAFAIAGQHPARPGALLPGVVGMIIVPPSSGEGPPIPDEGTLRAVARYLSEKVAPAGVEVAAAAPTYQRARLEISALLDPAADASATVTALLDAANRWLHPLTGGNDAAGWPFGAPIRHAALVRRLLEVSAVRAISQLGVVIDGLRSPGCGDHAIAPMSLLWPEGHQVFVTFAEQRS